jgi:predicted nucleic acid-binding Zn ribbon protein
MPIFEGQCAQSGCKDKEIYEYLLKSHTNDDPNCPTCGNKLTRLFSIPSVIWAKGIGQYCGENTEGHYAHYRDENGNPAKEFIKTRKQQKDFCKRHGFYDPTEIPSQPTSTADNVSGVRNTSGEKGAWI